MIFKVISALTLCLLSNVRAETLGSVLIANHVPLTNISVAEQQQAITSYSASKPGPVFLLAYYDFDGSQSLPSPRFCLGAAIDLSKRTPLRTLDASSS